MREEPTGAERVLARLRLGPASHRELYATTYCIVHSRIAELRSRGYRIECDKSGGEYTYRLVSPPAMATPKAYADPPELPSSPMHSAGAPPQLSLLTDAA